MAGSSFRSSLLIAALLAAAAAAGYDIYERRTAAPPAVVHDPPTAADIAKATEPVRKELDAAKLALAAIAADRDNLKQQLDALNKPAPAPAGDKARKGRRQGQGQGRRGRAEAIGRGDAATRRGAVRGRGLEAAHPAIGGAAARRAGALPAATGACRRRQGLYATIGRRIARALCRRRGGAGHATGGRRNRQMDRDDEHAGRRHRRRRRSHAEKGQQQRSMCLCRGAKAKLATLRVGDAVRVSGKINQDQNGQLVNLEECELRE